MKCTGWRSTFLLSPLAVILFLGGAAEGQAPCATATPALSGAVEDGNQSLVNDNLNAYAAIFRDSNPQAGNTCNAAAAIHLKNKLSNTYNANPPTHKDLLLRDEFPFQGWLEGSYVTYIFPAAIRLNQDGLLSSDPDLKNLLQRVADSMNTTAKRGTNGATIDLYSREEGCGLNSIRGFANTCMDDYSVAAAGFAWAAAYERMTNGPLLGQLVEAAHFSIDKSFDLEQSICVVPNTVATIRDSQVMPASGRGPCTGAAQDLAAGTAQTFSLNHNHQTPAYGYGLMTSISSAVLGLTLAGSNHPFSQDEKNIALALLAEASHLTEHLNPPTPSAPDYQFLNRPPMSTSEACLQVLSDSSQFQITAPFNPGGDCKDTGYFPRMYPVGDFYNKLNGTPVPANPLPLGFDSGLFKDPLPGGFFAMGREVYYGSLGWDARGGLLAQLPPLPPNPVYPSDGTLHASSSFALRWNDGLDASRRYPWWPVTYAIYYKAWAYGAAEPANYLLFGSGFQCNPDSTGACTMQVSNIGNGNYRWYVVANMDESVPAGSILSTQGSAAYFTVGYQPISTIPAPLPPNPAYPSDGTLHVSSSFSLRWNDGLDASRRNPLWPVTYAIYYKAWFYGAAEPSGYWLFGSNLQCNPDSTGVCTLAVSNISRGNYRWYIVANMDVTQSTGVSGSVLSTQSTVASFTVGYDASVSIAWVQPSALSWGAPNTLTAAGFATGGIDGVALQWRDVTLNGPWNTVAYQPPPNPSNGGWSNTIFSADNCHAFQATVQYSGVSASINYDGVALGYCSFRVIWIQPQSTAGFGPPGSLVVAGSAKGGPANAQVTLWFRDDTAQSGWTPLGYAPIPNSTGTWYNAIENVDYTHQYSVYITYDDRNSGSCSYFGNGSATNCP